jgi:hypothetical protein
MLLFLFVSLLPLVVAPILLFQGFTHTQRQKKKTKNKTKRRIKRQQKPQIRTQDKKTKKS